MIQVKGKPVLEHHVTWLKKNGITRVFISVAYQKETVVDYFQDGSKWGVSIEYLEESEPMGTGHPVRMLKGKVDSAFIVLNGDTLIETNLNDMIQFHRSQKKLATMAVAQLAEVQSKGTVLMDGDRIISFIEKPDSTAAGLINAGLYVLEPPIVDFLPNGFSMLEKDLFPSLASKNELVGWRKNIRFIDMGTVENLNRANREW